MVLRGRKPIIKNWKRVGEEMKRFDECHGPKQVLVKTFSLWIQIRDLLSEKPEIKILYRKGAFRE